MRNTISGQVFAEMIFCASAALDENRQQLNELNVFPVPDGDTGTNMSLTMSAAAAALHGRTPSAVGDAADTAASALLRGARGNSALSSPCCSAGSPRVCAARPSAAPRTGPRRCATVWMPPTKPL